MNERSECKPDRAQLVRSDLFVTGTDTGVGKTLLSALLVASLDRRYWKPIQTGACEGTDRETVMKWARVLGDRTCEESYVFAPPVSPHLAAEQKGITIELSNVRRPASPDPLIIEGAGGVMTPINPDSFMVDLMRHIRAPIVVATRSAVGTINHTLLTVSAIRNAGLDLRGVIMIGKENADNGRAVERYGNVPIIGSIPWLDQIDRDTLRAVFRQRFDAERFQ